MAVSLGEFLLRCTLTLLFTVAALICARCVVVLGMIERYPCKHCGLSHSKAFVPWKCIEAASQQHYRALCESTTQRKREFLESRAGVALVLSAFFPDDPLPWELDTWEGEGGR